MPPEMRYDILRDQWRREMFSLRTSLDKYPMRFPDTCLYEFTHALMHIVSGYRYTLADRSDSLRSACAHIRRTHLDYLKIIISHIHNHLQNGPASPNTLSFIKAKISARLDEFNDIGGLHENTVIKFRAIIDEYLPSDFSFPGSPESKILDGRTREDEVVRPDNAETTRPLRDTHALLEKWAHLESIMTSLHGQKLYDVSYSLVDGYIKYVDMKKTLTEQIVGFKLGIIETARNFDYDGALERKLNNSLAYTEIIVPAKVGLDSSDQAEQAEAFQRIAQNIDGPFSLVEEFLGLSGK
jgi:hypothetical protein